MSDLTFFSYTEPPKDPPIHTPYNPANDPIISIPADDFDVPSTNPEYTIWFLTVTTPHTDSFTTYGPKRTFADLIPAILQIASNSPLATRKIAALREDPDFGFDELGFNTFSIKLERGTYSVLRIHRQESPGVYDLLPAKAYTVTTHGPLAHDLGGSTQTVTTGRPKGLAANSTIVGAFATFQEAKFIAKQSMKELVRNREDIMTLEKTDDGGTGRWLSWAMNAKSFWEVKITCPD